MSLNLNCSHLLNPMLVQNLLDLARNHEGDTYAKLIPLLEGIHIVDWPFQFFDIDSSGLQA